jgi:hypothetical protein
VTKNWFFKLCAFSQIFNLYHRYDAGARDIAEELRVNGALHTLDLRRNGIGGGGARELAEALEENATLTAVTLRWGSTQLINRSGYQVKPFWLSSETVLAIK